jgi:hypothetical protein
MRLDIYNRWEEGASDVPWPTASSTRRTQYAASRPRPCRARRRQAKHTAGVGEGTDESASVGLDDDEHVGPVRTRRHVDRRRCIRWFAGWWLADWWLLDSPGPVHRPVGYPIERAECCQSDAAIDDGRRRQPAGTRAPPPRASRRHRDHQLARGRSPVPEPGRAA